MFWQTGIQKNPPGIPRVEYDTVGEIMKKWMRESVSPLMEKPHRFQALVDRAQQLVVYTEKKSSTRPSTPPATHHPVVDPDSSPMRDNM